MLNPDSRPRLEQIARLQYEQFLSALACPHLTPAVDLAEWVSAIQALAALEGRDRKSKNKAAGSYVDGYARQGIFRGEFVVSDHFPPHWWGIVACVQTSPRDRSFRPASTVFGIGQDGEIFSLPYPDVQPRSPVTPC